MGLSYNQILVMLVASAILTPPFVLFIPHARQSPSFDRLLAAATFAIAFLGAWAAQTALGPGLPEWTILDVAVVPILIGALSGAVALNLILFLLDLLEHPNTEDDGIMEEETDNSLEEQSPRE